jgi:hypothetical protein
MRALLNFLLGHRNPLGSLVAKHTPASPKINHRDRQLPSNQAQGTISKFPSEEQAMGRSLEPGDPQGLVAEVIINILNSLCTARYLPKDMDAQ